MARRVVATVLTVAAAACSREDAQEHPDANERRSGPARLDVLPPPSSAEWEALQRRIEARADSVDRALRRVPGLSRRDRGELRRDVNAVQIARARRLGIRRGADVDGMVEAGRLVRLPDTTRYWIIRELDYSVPYVTPSAEAMLMEIGERFHARLDSLGLPRYRLDITSILRTPEKQAELRRRNANASNRESAHEFGTTVDIAYRRYAPPADTLAGVHPELQAPARALSDSLWVETARERGAELQGVLGRVIAQMRREGKLLAIMERSQTVFHITVAKQLQRRSAE